MKIWIKNLNNHLIEFHCQPMDLLTSLKEKVIEDVCSRTCEEGLDQNKYPWIFDWYVENENHYNFKFKGIDLQLIQTFESYGIQDESIIEQYYAAYNPYEKILHDLLKMDHVLSIHEENMAKGIKSDFIFDEIYEVFMSTFNEEILSIVSMKNEKLSQEYNELKSDVVKRTYKLYDAIPKRESRENLIFNHLSHLSTQIDLANAKAASGEVLPISPPPKAYELPEPIRHAIKEEINRMQVTRKFFTIGKSRKQNKIEKAYEYAQSNRFVVNTLDEFLNLKNGKLPSLKEALQSPRKWPGAKPLYGKTDSWRKIEALIDAELNPTKKPSVL